MIRTASLGENRIYRGSELAQFVSASDLQSFSDLTGLPLEKMLFRFETRGLLEFTLEAEYWRDAYQKYPYDQYRVKQVTDFIRKGGAVKPIVVDSTQPNYPIVEGQHRLLALFDLKRSNVPVLFYLGEKK